MPDASAALDAARTRFTAGQRLSMGALAQDLGVDRVTLYRWLGSREELVGRLVWERMERALDRVDRPGAGTDRIADLLLGLVGGPPRTPRSPVQDLIEREGQLAMRVMTTGVVHRRLLERLSQAIAEEQAAGTLTVGLPAAQCAELLVKIGEAVFWFDVRVGRPLDTDNMRALLWALCPPAS